MKMLGLEPGEQSQASGTIGLVCAPLARFTDFWLSWISLMRPGTARILIQQGMDVTGNFNRLVNDMAGEWLWIMGDDHTFAPDILMNLLAHEVDVVVPLCLKKDAPFDPVVYEGEEMGEDGLVYHHVARLPEHGLTEIYAAGSAGMLIRKHVFDAIERPVFTTEKGMQNEDLLFCRKVREAGFKIYCDVDQKMGHIGVNAVYPAWQGNRWGAVMDLGGGQISPVFAFTADELERMEQAVLESDAA